MFYECGLCVLVDLEEVECCVSVYVELCGWLWVNFNVLFGCYFLLLLLLVFFECNL